MDVFLVITQGIGLAIACGVRPFLPALLAGALAGAGNGVDFGGTDYAFLERPVFLLLTVLALVATVVLERRRSGVGWETAPAAAAIAGVRIGLGALELAGPLADEGEPPWPRLIAGAACAALAQSAARSVFRRTARRLDPDARGALSVYADGIALVLAALAILVPPVSLVALAFLAVLLVRGRRRDESKFAGLRVLR